MGDEFYCILKLVSGEEILSLIMIDENDGDPIIILQNPVIMKPVTNSTGDSYVKIKPWMEMSNDDMFLIRLDKVITMTETKDTKLIQLYEYYLNDDSIEVYKPAGQVKPSSSMGYVSSVEKARKNLENIFKFNKKSEHYVNNKELLEALIVYRSKVEKAEQKYFEKYGKYPPKSGKWEGKPKIPDYLGECFLKIATHLSYKPNFVNYMFREDMCSDGIENCVQYIHNFNPERSQNPFAYFTQIIHYAFLRRIQKEKKQLEIKTKIIERTGFDEVMTIDDGLLSGNNSEYNSMKDAIQYKNNNR